MLRSLSRKAGIASWILTGSLFVALLAHLGHTEVVREKQEMCLAENLYHEARGEITGAKYLIGMITLARVADPKWPATVCSVVAEDRQFSWVLDHKLATKRDEQASWDEAKRIARDLMRNAWVNYLLPRGWECARFYKRTDGKGVSKKAMQFFEARLFPVGSVGSHTFFQERRGCATPLPTT